MDMHKASPYMLLKKFNFQFSILNSNEAWIWQ